MKRTQGEEHNDFGNRKGRGTRRRVPIFRCSEANQKSDEKRVARLKQQEIFIPQWPEPTKMDFIPQWPELAKID